MGKFNKLIQSVNRRSLKYGSISVALIVCVIAIAVVVNLLVSAVQDKGLIKTKFDLTSNKLYSIGDTTKSILKGLNKNVEIYGLIDIGQVNSNDDLKKIKEILGQYGEYSHVKIYYEDPDKNPKLIKQIDPDGLKDIKKGDFVVKSGNKTRKVSGEEIFKVDYNQQTGQPSAYYFIGEQGFTGAIKYVTSDKTPVVYFTEGHQEGKLASDYTSLKTQMETNNYEVKSLNLITQAKVPDDAEILMIASPKVDISTSEREKITEFFNRGGKGVFLFDSLENAPKFPELEKLLADNGVGLNYDKVKETDENRFYPGNPYAVVLDVPKSQVIPSSMQLLLADSRSLNILKNQKESIKVTSLAKTSGKARGEQIDKSNGNDLKGPLDLAVAIENSGSSKPTRILVMGNGFFVSDSAKEQYGQYFQFGNRFFTQSLNWLMDKKDEVIIEAKSFDTTQLNIKSATQANILALFLIILLPLLILGTGTVVWMRRRHL